MRENHTANEQTQPPLMSVEEVLAVSGGRWKSARSLAAASRRGHGPGGRVVLSSNRAAYDRAQFLAWLSADEQRRAERLAAMQARAAHAREARAAKRSAPDAEVAVALGAAEAAIAALEAVAEEGAK